MTCYYNIYTPLSLSLPKLSFFFRPFFHLLLLPISLSPVRSFLRRRRRRRRRGCHSVTSPPPPSPSLPPPAHPYVVAFPRRAQEVLPAHCPRALHGRGEDREGGKKLLIVRQRDLPTCADCHFDSAQCPLGRIVFHCAQKFPIVNFLPSSSIGMIISEGTAGELGEVCENIEAPFYFRMIYISTARGGLYIIKEGLKPVMTYLSSMGRRDNAQHADSAHHILPFFLLYI